MVSVSKDFQYAINITLDSSSNDKLAKYILTSNSVETIKKLFLPCAENVTDKSHFLIAPYGKGKSHLALVLLNMLLQNKSTAMKSLLQQIKMIDKNFYDEVDDFFQNRKKLLPVVVDYNGSGDLEQSFMYALKKTLVQNKIENIVLDTNFSAAVSAIEKWRRNYKITYNAFTEKLGGKNEVQKFIDSLNSFDETAYNKFLSIYPELTSGSTFTSETKISCVEYFNIVNKKICENDYSGIYVIFDEFSKFLEANKENNIASDLKFLQDFAERANRSALQEQLHLLLITHQSLLNYTNESAKTQIDDWKAVANRFTELRLYTSTTQYMNLISKIISHDEILFEKYFVEHKDELEKTWNAWKKESILSKNLADSGNHSPDGYDIIKLFKNIFPLHPSTLFLLPLLSEKVAQNERTVFTFLASDTQQNTLHTFIKKHNFASEKKVCFLTPDLLYDYFVPLFEKENFKSAIFQLNKKTETALAKVSDDAEFSLHKKILKTLCILSIIDGSLCNEKMLKLIFPFAQTTDAITYVIAQKLIRRYEFVGTLAFAENTNIDVDAKIEAKIKELKRTYTVAEILSDYVKHKAFYPVEYNERFCVTRFFRIEFIDEDKVDLSVDGFKEIYDSSIKSNFADGILYCVLSNDESVFDKVKNIRIQGTVFVVTRKKTSLRTLQNFVYKFFACKKLCETIDNDFEKRIFASVQNDYEEYIKSFIENYLDSAKQKSFYYTEGKSLNAKNKIELGKQLSDMLAERYKKFPVILNEMVNKNQLTSQTISKCKNVLSRLFESNEENILPLLGFNNGSQEATIIKSVYKKNKIFREVNGKWIFAPFSNEAENANKNLYDLLCYIDSEIKQNTSENFGNIYTYITCDMGLRKGLVPLLLVAVLNTRKEHIYFYNTTEKTEYALDAETLFAMCENPDDWQIKFVNHNAEHDSYLTMLEKCFESYLPYVQKSSSRAEKLVSAMSMWYQALPKISKTEMEAKAKKLFAPLSQTKINVHEYLFETVPNILQSDLAKSGKEFVKIKNEADEILDTQISKIILKLSKIFEADVEMLADTRTSNLLSATSKWAQTLSADAKNHVASGINSNLLSVFTSNYNSDEDFVRALAIADTQLRIEDWNVAMLEKFYEDILRFKNFYDEFQSEHNSAVSPNEIKIAHTKFAIQFPQGRREKDNTIVRTFDFSEKKSRVQKLLANEIKNNIAEYQDALSQEEKCAVLFEVIKETLGL